MLGPLPVFLRVLTALLIYWAAICGVAIALVRARVFFFARHHRLWRKGLDLALAGKPIEAERCYRAALDLGARVPESDHVRLLVCLGNALMDQKRYGEAKQYLTQALKLVDPTGGGQGSMCDLLLAQRAEPEKALEMADEAMRLRAQRDYSQAYGDRWEAVSRDLFEAKTWARKAQALVLLDRQTEARQAMDRALRIVEMSNSELQRAMPGAPLKAKLILGNRVRRHKQLTISETHWQIGLALLAMRDNAKAAEHFLIVRNTDRGGKYRNLAQEQLGKLGYADKTPLGNKQAF
jgi:tetratricopeptide (TPR) repeat protein